MCGVREAGLRAAILAAACLALAVLDRVAAALARLLLTGQPGEALAVVVGLVVVGLAVSLEFRVVSPVLGLLAQLGMSLAGLWLASAVASRLALAAMERMEWVMSLR